jgi:hypothetical protein
MSLGGEVEALKNISSNSRREQILRTDSLRPTHPLLHLYIYIYAPFFYWEKYRICFSDFYQKKKNLHGDDHGGFDFIYIVIVIISFGCDFEVNQNHMEENRVVL